MKAVALILTTLREHLRPTTVLLVALAFVIWIQIAETVGAPAGEARLHLRERAVLAAMAGVGGLFAIFVGTRAFADEIRSRRLSMLVVRPVRTIEIVLGRALGVMACLAVLLAGMAIGGLAWILAGASADSIDAKTFATARAHSVLQGEGTVPDRAVVPLKPGGPELRFRFRGIRTLGDDGLARIRLDIRNLPPELSLRVPVVIRVGAPGDESPREAAVLLHRRRTLDLPIRGDDIGPGGRLEIAIRSAGQACAARVEASSVECRARRASYAASFGRAAVGASLAVMLLGGLGVALSTLLTAPTGVLALLFAFGFGYLRPFAIDLADGLARIAATGEGGATASFAWKLNEVVLRATSVLVPPFGRFHLAEPLVDGRVPPLARLGEAFGVCALYLVPACLLATWALNRRSRS